MDATVILAAGFAGAAYTLTPGPAFLALLGIGAGQGRKAGLGFLCGHFAGDILWSALALVALIGATELGTVVFDLLGLVSGSYLLWLGIRAVRVRRQSGGRLDTEVRRPLRRGLAFGLTNPKGYPVAVAMFTALLSGQAELLTWANLPLLLLAAAAGFIIADALLVAFVGAGGVRRFYRRHEVWIVRGSGVMFIGFGLQAIVHAGHGLMPASIGRQVAQ